MKKKVFVPFQKKEDICDGKKSDLGIEGEKPFTGKSLFLDIMECFVDTYFGKAQLSKEQKNKQITVPDSCFLQTVSAVIKYFFPKCRCGVVTIQKIAITDCYVPCPPIVITSRNYCSFFLSIISTLCFLALQILFANREWLVTFSYEM